MRSNTSVIKNVCETAGKKMHEIYMARCGNNISKFEAFQRLCDVRDSLITLLEMKKNDMTVTSKKMLKDYIALANSYIQKVG